MKTLRLLLYVICASVCINAFAQSSEVPNQFRELIGDSIQAEIVYYRMLANNYATGKDGYTIDSAKAKKYGSKVIDICTSLYESRASDAEPISNIWDIYHILMDDNIGLKDEKKALMWLQKAADSGDKPAVVELISYYSDKDMDKVNALMDAIDIPMPQEGKLPPLIFVVDFEEMMNVLGLYEHSTDSAEDVQYQKKHVADLQYCYDDENSDKRLKRICAENLYSIYLQGLPGVAPNEYLGVYWMEKAASLGDRTAIVYLAKYYLDKDADVSKKWIQKLYSHDENGGDPTANAATEWILKVDNGSDGDN